MKHVLIFTFFTALMSFSAFAQTEQSAKFIGGTFQISITSNEVSDNTTSSFVFNPQFGYFLKDQWAVGSGLGLSVNSNGDTDVFFSISPFTRYYFPVVEGTFFIFGEAGFTVGFGDEYSSFGLSAEPGFAFFPSERWAVELGFNLLSFGFTNPEGSNNNGSNFSFGSSTFSPSLGVYFFF